MNLFLETEEGNWTLNSSFGKELSLGKIILEMDTTGTNTERVEDRAEQIDLQNFSLTWTVVVDLVLLLTTSTTRRRTNLI